MIKALRVGTRESKLAIWQAEKVITLLNENGHDAEMVFIKSEGDINLTTPLYELGIQGIFTKSLDIALLENRIDIAVHSYKDVPTAMAAGLRKAAVLKRGNPHDVLVFKNEEALKEYHSQKPLTIATSSIRRKAQWLYKHKNSKIENIRGNVNSRVQKVQTSDWHGAIFAAAGLERLGLTEKDTGPQVLLDWMLPAPAQGAVVLVCREDDTSAINISAALNDEHTDICTAAERDFLRLLQGGCSTPISAHATIKGNEIFFTGNVTATDGSETVSVNFVKELSAHGSVASMAADDIIAHGGKHLLKK